MCLAIARRIGAVLVLLLAANVIAADVPNSVSEAFANLDGQLSSDERASIAGAKTEDDLIQITHMSLGMYIRNAWFRQGHSKLIEEFHSYGAESLDDVSAMLLWAYWRHLNGMPFDLKVQGECYRRYYLEENQRKELAEAHGSTSYEAPSWDCPGA